MTNHLSDLVKINMVEKAELVDRVVDMVDKVIMLPKFVREFGKSHMTDEDVWLLGGVRRTKALWTDLVTGT